MKAPTVERANDFWWTRLPSAASRLSLTLSAILSDGFYLSATPPLGAFAPPLALLLGLLVGWLHPGFAGQEIFTASLFIMALMAVLGAFSSAIGWWICVGYVVGDFFLYNHDGYRYFQDSFVRQLVYARAPLLIIYLLLSMLLVFIPLMSRGLCVQTLSRFPRGGNIVNVAAVVLQALVQGALVWVWANTVPTLIRPVYTWRGDIPTVEVMSPLQEHGWVLIVLATLCGAARVVLERRWLPRPVVARRAKSLGDVLKGAATRRPLPAVVAVSLKVVLTTFILAGTLGTWLDALALAFVLAFMLLARQYVVGRLQAWTQLVSRLPLLLRLAVGTVINYYVATQIITLMWDSTSTFRPIVVSVVISLAVLLLLLPDVGTQVRSKLTGTGQAPVAGGGRTGEAA